MDKAHQFASMDESSDDSHFGLHEVSISDLLKSLEREDLFRGLLATKSDQLLFQESSELGHTASELSSHILLDLLPRLHSFNLLHSLLHRLTIFSLLS